jgi:hypothetical protein
MLLEESALHDDTLSEQQDQGILHMQTRYSFEPTLKFGWKLEDDAS